MKTLGDELPEEIERCQDLLVQYTEIGQAGAFGAAMIRRDIGVALRAMAENDLPAMIAAYKVLKECK